jgi:cytochrome c biogenesis protein CcdA/glutaredoxin
VLVLLALLAWWGGAALTGPGAQAVTEDAPSPTIVLFHGEGCPHCAAEREFLTELVSAHPEITVAEHEVWNDAAGRELLTATAEEMGFDPVGVPVTIVGNQVWIGFDDATAALITAAALQATAQTPANDTATPTTAATANERDVDVPLVGVIDLDRASLLGATVAIGFVDGVNPCSLWVLSLLLAMVLNRGSRGRVLLVGGTFLAVTALMYGLYMIALYSATSAVASFAMSSMLWLRITIAVIAGTFGVLQLKDGLGIQAGPSLSISPGQRPGLYARMRQVASPDRALAAALVGTVVLAVAVSLIETPCTAGLPLLWTTLLAEQGVGWLEALGLFGVYLVVFLLDELAVFAVAVITLRSARMQDRHGRLLKIVAGSVLIVLAVTMLIAPGALTTLAGTAIVFAAAAAMTGIAYGASRASSRSPTASRTTE